MSARAWRGRYRAVTAVFEWIDGSFDGSFHIETRLERARRNHVRSQMARYNRRAAKR